MNLKKKRELEELMYFDPSVTVIEDENGEKAKPSKQKSRTKKSISEIDFPIVEVRKPAQISTKDMMFPSLKMSTTEKILNGAGYLAKEIVTEALGGLSGIGEATTTEIQSNLKKGKDKSLLNTGLELLNSFAEWSNPIKAIADNTKISAYNAFFKENKKSTFDKTVDFALNSASPETPAGKFIEMLGSALPKDADEKVKKLGKTISDPYYNAREKLDKEKEIHGTPMQTLGTVSGVIGRMLPTIGVTMATKSPQAGLATMAIGAKGSATTEAKSSGADLETAIKIGNAKGEVEYLTEMITGGLKVFGKGTLDDLAEKGILKLAKKEASQKLLKEGYNISGEILEETISDIAGTAIDKGTVNPDANYGVDDWSNTALVTALSTAALNVIARGKVGGINLTENERNVVNDIVKDKTIKAQKEKAINEKANQIITERESTFGTLDNDKKKSIINEVSKQLDNGEIDFAKSTLSKKEISKIEEKVKIDLEKGNIDIESIENTLSGSKTSQIKELKAQLWQATNAEEKGQIQARINELEMSKSDELRELLKNDTLLQNSYREANLKRQSFSYEAQEKDSDYKKKLATEFSKKANNSTKSHETFEMLSKLANERQTRYHITNNKELTEMGYSVEGKTINGFVNKNGEVLINIDSDTAINRIIGHETTHLFEGTQEHEELKEMVKKFAITKGEYDTRLKEVQRLYKGTNANIENEVTSDIIGDYLFTDTDFINNLSTEKPNIFKRMYEEIKHLYKLATAGSREARQLERVKKAFDKAYKNTTTNSDGEVKYSIESFGDKKYVKHDRNVITGNNPQDWAKQINNYINNTIRKGEDVTVYSIDGDALTITEDTAGKAKFRNVVVLKDGSKRLMTDDEYATKLRAESHIDELSEVSIKGKNIVPDYKNHYFAKDGFNYRTAYFLDEDGTYYKLTLSVGKNGSISTVYNVGKLKEATAPFMVQRPTRNKAEEHIASNNTNISQKKNGVNNSIHENSENSADVLDENIKKSMSDSSTYKNEIAPVRNDIFGKDIKFKEPIDNDIAPVKEIAPIKKISKGEAEFLKQNDLDKLGTKSNYLTKKSDQLYSEIKGLNKGIKASEELSCVLDFGFKWSDIKTALLNIKFHPDNVVNQNSEAESVIREIISRDYDSQYEDIIYNNYEISNDYNTTVGQSNKLKSQNYKKLLNGYDRDKKKSKDSLNNEIAKKLNEYDSKKNKNTKTANNILQQIESLKNRRDNIQIDYDRKIKTATKRLDNLLEQGDSLPITTYAEVQQGYINEIKEAFAERGYDFDKVLEKAKNKSTFSSVDNTPQRFVEKTLGYKEGQILNDLTMNRTALNESMAIKWINSFKNKKDGKLWNLSSKYDIKPNSKEDAAAQMYAEGFYVDEDNSIIAYGDAELSKDFSDVKTQKNIKALVNEPEIRQIYDDTLNAINESRVRNGYPSVPRRNDYFLHFRAMNDTFSTLGIPFNPKDIKAKDLPTDINGMTADLKPGQPYFASANRRTGIRTSFSLLGGMDRYLSSAKNQIFHIDDIQALRGLRNYVADMFGQAKGLSGLNDLSEIEAEQRIKDVYDCHLSSFAKFLNEQANILAGKTALVDRGIEGIIGRRGITFIDTIRKQVGTNMIGFNVSSSLTNLISAVQATAKLSKIDAIKGLTQTTSNKVNNLFGRTDGFVENDPTMIRRKGENKFYQTPFEKSSNLGYVLMSGIDNISTEYIIRSKYSELTRKGMDSKKAQIEAGKWAMRILGDRSIGQQPQIFNSKMLGTLTQFQLEVRNQLDCQFYDTVQEANVSTDYIQNRLKRNTIKAAKVTSTLAQLAVFQHLFGIGFEAVTGYNPSFDIISVILTAFGYGDDDDNDNEDTTLDNIEQAFLELLEDLPYTSTFTGGRIPISSALPLKGLVMGKDSYGNEKSRFETFSEALPYYVLPTGYGQIKKTYNGFKMFDKDLPVTGSYTDSGNLRYPVEDTIKNRIQASLFGQYANENARNYFDNERVPLKKKQIEEYKELDMPIADYWKYRSGLKDKDKFNEKFDYVDSLNVSTEQKNIMVNNIVNRKDKVDMSNYSDFGNYEEFDFATKNKDKYTFFKNNGISYKDYSASEESREAYNWAFNNPELYEVSTAVTNDVVAYRQYSSDLYELKADKDSNGKSISGSRKAKVVDYINNLDTDYGEKLILYKTEYVSDDSVNYDIVEYLNSREDVNYQQMKIILTKLGMSVDQNGNITW